MQAWRNDSTSIASSTPVKYSVTSIIVRKMSTQENLPTLGDQIRLAGREILGAPADQIGTLLAGFLETFISEPYRIEAGYIADFQGNRAGPFAALICTGGQPVVAAGVDPAVPTESVAVAFDVVHTLDLESLSASYDRIAAAKAMHKVTPVSGKANAEPTLGIILSADAAVSLDDLAQEVRRLNEGKHSDQWVDAIAVGAKGKIGLSLQWVGSKKINGSLLPASPGYTANGVYAFYAPLAIAATGPDTFNATMDLVAVQLLRWNDGYVTPGQETITAGMSRQSIVVTGYMPDLSGRLLPAPYEQYDGRRLPPKQVLLVPKGGKEPMGAMSFMKWLDGGVIMLRGKIPLEMMMVFMAGAVDKTALKINKLTHDDLQVSMVLPINERHYATLLRNIQQRGGFDVKQDAGKFVIQKLADEGANSPFMARVCIAPLKLIENSDRKEAFSHAYETLMTTLMEIRDMAKEVATKWGDYVRKVEDGSTVRFVNGDIHIDEYVDKPLARLVNEFLSAATRSFKDRMQGVTKTLDVDIGCLYQKDAKFERGVAKLEQNNPRLAAYLCEARVWGSALVEARNGLDHGGWRLESTPIAEAGGKVSVTEPNISGVPVTQWVACVADRIACFVEDITIHCIQQRLGAGITLAEIPLAERDAEMPVRFKPIVIDRVTPAWEIRYHTSRLEET